MRSLESERKNYGQHITPMDLDKIKQSEAQNYHILAIEFIRDKIMLLLESEAYAHMG
ncbi:hypothetical protein D3C71_2107420 [compost metagenome]